MKTKMNVLKKEAEQICLWGEAILSKDMLNYLTISKDGNFTFWVWGGSQDRLSDEEEYKNYEWRLTDIKDLEQGDLILLTGGFNKYYRKSYILTVFDNENFCWQIRENRPEKINIFCNVYKLFKKEMK